MKSIQNGFSVIVCCYNSEKRIRTTLDYLFRLSTSPQFLYEVIIVDNASSDHTVAVCNRFYEDAGKKIAFKIVSEKKPGLNYARERGLAEASFTYAIFCDDDNWLQSDYLLHSFEIMSRHNDVGVLGGVGVAVTEIDPPDWFESVKSAYAVGKKDEPQGVLQLRESFIAGAGMVLRAEAWKKIKAAGFRSHLSDRKGKELTSGGDLELSYATKMAGFKLFYSEKLVFSHFIPAERLQWSYILRGCTGYGNAVNAIESYLYVMKPEIQNEQDIKPLFNLGVVKNIGIGFFRSAICYFFQRYNRSLQIKYRIARAQLVTSLVWLFQGRTILKELVRFKQRLNRVQP